jgi:hypothetical protein
VDCCFFYHLPILMNLHYSLLLMFQLSGWVDVRYYVVYWESCTCFVLFCFVLFCFVLFCFVLTYSTYLGFFWFIYAHIKELLMCQCFTGFMSFKVI